MYRREARNEVTVARYAKDIPEDAWDRRLFNHALVGLSIGVAFLVVVFGPRHRAPGRLLPRELLPGRQRGGERHGPPLRPPPLRQHGRQPALAGLHDGRARGTTTTTTPCPRRRGSRTTGTRFDLGWLVIRVLCALGLAKLREPALERIQTAPRRAA